MGDLESFAPLTNIGVQATVEASTAAVTAYINKFPGTTTILAMLDVDEEAMTTSPPTTSIVELQESVAGPIPDDELSVAMREAQIPGSGVAMCYLTMLAFAI